MNRLFTNLITFTIGAAIGSVVTFKLVKTKYEKIADEEIKSVREYYRQKRVGEKLVEGLEAALEEGANEDVKKAVSEKVESAYNNYQQIANRYTTQQLTKPDSILEEEEDEDDMPEPYVITPEEFSDGDYCVETLTYYADGVIEDGYEDVWSEDEIKYKITSDFASHFGEYENDSVYVRNDYEEIDYEILRDIRRYSDIHK